MKNTNSTHRSFRRRLCRTPRRNLLRRRRRRPNRHTRTHTRRHRIRRRPRRIPSRRRRRPSRRRWRRFKRSSITHCTEITYLTNGAFIGCRAMDCAFGVGIVNANAAEPMIGGIVGGEWEGFRWWDGHFGGYFCGAAHGRFGGYFGFVGCEGGGGWKCEYVSCIAGDDIVVADVS